MNKNLLEIKNEIEGILRFPLVRHTNSINNEDGKDDFILDSLSHSDLSIEEINRVKELILKALRINPRIELFWASLGYVYYMQSEFTKSIKCFFKTIEINPENVDNWIDLGFAYRAYGDFKTSDFLFLNHRDMIKNYNRSEKIDNKTLSVMIKNLINKNKRIN